MKNATIFWQSQTGNSLACAKAAAEALQTLGYSVILHNMMSPEEKSSEDSLLVFAFPVYNFKPATLTRDFIRKLTPRSSVQKALAICSCTSNMANTGVILRRLLKTKNIELSGVIKVLSSESFILLRKWMPVTRKQDLLPNEKSMEQIKDFIRRKIGDGFKKDFLFFNPFSFWHWFGVVGADNGPGRLYAKRILRGDLCTLCGMCLRLCPSGAIQKAGTKLSCDIKKCVGCCGCFNICPVRAWELKNYEEKYFLKNPHTPALLKEMIHS